MKTLKYNLAALSSAFLCMSLLVVVGKTTANDYVYQGSPSVHRAPTILISATSMQAVGASNVKADTYVYQGSPSVHRAASTQSASASNAKANTYVYQGSPSVHRSVKSSEVKLPIGELLASNKR